MKIGCCETVQRWGGRMERVREGGLKMTEKTGSQGGGGVLVACTLVEERGRRGEYTGEGAGVIAGE
jgi:hypothetical protein